MWIFYAFLSAVTAALVAIFGKLGLKDIDPTLATTIRAVLMAVFLIVASVLFNKFDGFSLAGLQGRQWFFIFLAAIAGALSWLFYFIALKNGAATDVVAIDRLSIVFVLLLAALFLGEALTWQSIFGGILVLVGAVLVSLK